MVPTGGRARMPVSMLPASQTGCGSRPDRVSGNEPGHQADGGGKPDASGTSVWAQWTHLQARSKEVLARVGLSDRAKDMVETLSGGMQRRVELAKGLIHSPAVLLLDEPSTGLDPGARLDLWHYLRILRDEEGVTILVTTHLMEEAEHCDRLAILNEGNLVALGTPAELKAAIGGDVVLFETASEAAALLAARYRWTFAVRSRRMGGTRAAGTARGTSLRDRGGRSLPRRDRRYFGG